MNKKLVGIVSVVLATLAAGFLELSAFRKVYNSELAFKGEIGNEQVEFRQVTKFWPNSNKDTNYLTITRKDGETIIYIDRGNDLRIDEVIIGGQGYRSDTFGKGQWPLEQKKFNAYLREIPIYKQQ